MVKYLWTIVLFSLVSCSTTDFKSLFSSSDETGKHHEDMMEDFQVDNDVLDKFRQKDSVPKKESTKVLPTPKKAISTKKRVSKKNKVKKAKIPKLKPVKKREIIKAQVKTTPAKSLYPEDDYPESYKDFDLESEEFWNKYKPINIPGEKSVFSIKYAGISTGNITIETKSSTTLGDQEVFHYRARVKTSSYYSYLYEVDDICDTFVRKDNFLPLKFSLIQRESSQDIDDLQLFDHEKLKTYTFYKRVTKKKTKKSKKEKYIPKFFQDPLSIMYFIRGLPMNFGHTYSVPIINKGKAEIMTITPRKIETIETEIGKKKAYKVDIVTHHKGKTLEGGKMSFWFAADSSRAFLAFNAKIKLGSISGTILKYER